MNIPLLATGLNGLVGSKFATDFADRYDFTNLSVSDKDNPVDVTDFDQVKKAFCDSEAQFVVHLAAFTDVTKAWEQNGDKDGLAYQVNVVGTENIVTASQETGKHLIHISTAYVFDGEKDGLYTEEDQTNPIEWYGQTKLWAEEAVQNSDIDWTILRIDQPFRSDNFPKPDLVRKTIQLIEKGIPLFSDHYFGPTHVDDFAKVIDWVIRTGSKGLYHASSGEQWSDYKFGELISKTFNLDHDLRMTDLEGYLKTLNRPYQKNTAMDVGKLKSVIDFEMMTVEESIANLSI